MNKLFIDNNINIENIVVDKDTELKIDFNTLEKKLSIDVLPSVYLKVFDLSKNTKNNIVYNVGSSAVIEIDKFSIDCSDTVTININSENAKVTFNNSLINYQDNTYSQFINHNAKNTESKIVNNALNVLDKKLELVVNGIVKKDSINTIFKQDNKIINLNDGNSLILPNLIVDNNDIVASHSAYIGKFDEDVVFYLMTRGLSEDDANKLLIKGFLINNMNLLEDDKNLVESIIDNI